MKKQMVRGQVVALQCADYFSLPQLCYESTIRRLEESIARERQATPVARSRSDEGGSGDEDACATSTKSVMVQTDDWEEQHQEGVSN